MTVETIAYVARQALQEHELLAHGFVSDPQGRAYRYLLESLRWGPRPDLEEDPSRKQLIPYVVVHQPDPDRIWTMRRKRAQTEARLHEQRSIGVGGHISRGEDGGQGDPIEAGMWRELDEELVVSPEDLELTYRGLLNDDTNEVGAVHLGVVYGAKLRTGAPIAIREIEKMEGGFEELSALRARHEQLETWSSLLLPALKLW